ncbi:hypothetical protein [Amycolatopsis sp. ATCC 39116]|uniref:AMP-binding enzyme n=1 Tax=Amycolatopsis sp. (strain ATCC 39116 / 75iv2) TaxID=385957 RepID=UPI00351067A1
MTRHRNRPRWSTQQGRRRARALRPDRDRGAVLQRSAGFPTRPASPRALVRAGPAAQVERAIIDDRSVRDCGVVGVAVEHGDQEIKAFNVLESGQDADPAAITEHCSARIAYCKVPRYLQFAAELPRPGSDVRPPPPTHSHAAARRGAA